MVDVDLSADFDALIEIDHVGIQHAQAARGNSSADGSLVVGSMNSVNRPANVHGTCTKRIVWTTFDEFRNHSPFFFQFAAEAALLATVGALAGLGVGVLVSRVLASAAGLPLVIDVGNTLVALALAIVLNLLFASWPALRAARMDPIRALRHE